MKVEEILKLVDEDCYVRINNKKYERIANGFAKVLKCNYYNYNVEGIDTLENGYLIIYTDEE